MKPLVKFILISVLMGFIALYAAYQLLNKQMQQVLTIEKPTTFTVEHGQSFKSITHNLKSQKIVKESDWIYWYSRINKLSHKVQAGEYLIPTKINSIDLINLLVAGKVKQYSFTIIEGWSFKELLVNINNNKELVPNLKEINEEELMQLIGLETVHPEGQFLPETYAFTKGSTASSILKRAHKDLKKLLTKTWQERQKPTPLKNVYEALILASIVEKETGVAEERPLIAGVFINRLNKKMRLQTDPTVIYGMGDKYKGDIRFRDLRNYTPYNTYKIKGLPPTPIAMAGKAAITASLNPQTTNALYFVAMGEGKHLFSETLEAHNKAVDKYQRKRRPIK